MTERWVLDASAAVRLVMRMDEAPALIERLASANLVIAPTLYCAETANALWKYVGAGQLDQPLAVQRCEEAHQLIDNYTPDCELQVEALALAAQSNHPVYSALYAVLARRHAAGIITFDKRLKRLLGELGIPCL